METIGQAARRLLERLERAAKAKGIDRGTVSGCCLTPTEPLNAGESVSPKIATDEPTPRVFEDRHSASRGAGGDEGGPSSRLAAPVRPASNDNRRAHTRTALISS